METTTLHNREAGDPWRSDQNQIEHIDLHGQLKVPVTDWFLDPPEREGWEPFWVNINLDRDPVKIYTYRRTA